MGIGHWAWGIERNRGAEGKTYCNFFPAPLLILFQLMGKDLKLHGKSALVSGSTAGIGLAIALGLAQEGAALRVDGGVIRSIV